IYLYLSIMNYRLYILYWLIVRKRPLGGWLYHALFSLVWLPVLLFVIITAANPSFVGTTTGNRNPGICTYPGPMQTFMSVVLNYLAAVAIIINILIRNIRKTFNEYRETLLSTIALVAMAIFIGVSNWQYLPFYSWGRFVTSTVTLLTVHVYFWTMLARPLYAYLFNREAYLVTFKEHLSRDGFSHFASNSNRSRSVDTTVLGISGSSRSRSVPDPQDNMAHHIPQGHDQCSSLYATEVSEVELTDVKSLFKPLQPMSEKNYIP
ncbi:hypothetical protein H4R33_003998, partial [Dimargaris cristalligena]